jgi:hypothetical protein
VTFWARRNKTLPEKHEVCNQVPDVIMQNASENILVTITSLFFPITWEPLVIRKLSGVVRE